MTLSWTKQPVLAWSASSRPASGPGNPAWKFRQRAHSVSPEHQLHSTNTTTSVCPHFRSKSLLPVLLGTPPMSPNISRAHSTTNVIAFKASDWWCGQIQSLDVHTHKILSALAPKSKRVLHFLSRRIIPPLCSNQPTIIKTIKIICLN